MTRYVLIGNGVAAIGAAQAIRQGDPTGNILLVSDEPEGYYSRPGLAYLLTCEISEAHLYPFTPKDYKHLSLDRRHGRVTKLHTASQQIELDSGEWISYDRLLLAVGAQAARLTLPGIEAEGVVKLDTLNDARQIIHLARRSRSAVVVGGGITALEIVEGLAALGVHPHYFLRGDRYWSNVLDETESHIVEERLRADGVELHYHTELAQIVQRKGKVSGVITQTGEHIPCDILAVAIGVLPRIDLAVQAGLKTERGILVDEYLQTSDPLIFAAGDVAQVYDPLLRKSLLDSLWTPARLQGSVAGLNMTGQTQAYHKGISFNITRLAGLTTTIIGSIGSHNSRDEDTVGIVRGDSEGWRETPDAIAAQADFEINRLRVLVGKDTLVGALLMGDQSLSRLLQRLVNEQIDITPIRDQLIEPGAPIARLVTEFWQDYKQKEP